MPHWVFLLVVTVVGWLVVAVVGGLLVGRALGVLNRGSAEQEGPVPDRAERRRPAASP